MKILFEKIHHVQANIGILALYVLILGAFVGLLSTSFLQDMISSSGQIRDFYQSYYLAKGGIELGIVAVNSYEYGFEDYLSGSSDIIRNNLHCAKECNLDISIKSRITDAITINEDLSSITETICNQNTEHTFHLSPGQSQIFPLFADERKITHQLSSKNIIKNVFDNNNYAITISSWGNNLTTPLGIGIVLGKENQIIFNQIDPLQQPKLFVTGTLNNGLTIYNTLYTRHPNIEGGFGGQAISNTFTNSFTPNKDYFNYLFITNMAQLSDNHNTNFEYCLDIKPSTVGFVGHQSIITATANYASTMLSLQARAKRPLIDYIIRPSTDI